MRRLDILLTTPEEPLDNVTKQLVQIFGVSGAFISFIDEDTQYYKSEVGLPPEFARSRTEPREISLCSYVVGTNEPLVVEDLSADTRFRDNVAVNRFGIRFYAGAPLRGEGGHGVGSLCIVDHRPRTISAREQQMLELLAEGVMAHVRLQVASRRLVERSLEIDRDLQQAMSVQRFLLPPPVRRWRRLADRARLSTGRTPRRGLPRRAPLQRRELGRTHRRRERSRNNRCADGSDDQGSLRPCHRSGQIAGPGAQRDEPRAVAGRPTEPDGHRAGGPSEPARRAGDDRVGRARQRDSTVVA